MKRIKLILATVAAMAVMMMAAVSPAFAGHGWWFSDWWQWRNTNWWCYSAWEHVGDGEGFRSWEYQYLACWHPQHGWWVG